MTKVTTAGRTALAVMTAFVVSGAAIGLDAARAAQEPQAWIHLDMTGEQGNMNVNLPLAAIEAALALAPEAIVDADGHFQLGGRREVPVAAIRAAWNQLRDAGDVEIASIQHDGQSVRVAREGELVLVNVTGTDDGGEHGDGDRDAEHGRDHRGVGEVQVRVPVRVVDALLSGTGETLDVRAALRELSTLRGEVVQVVQPDARIRVWIDESPTQ